MRVCPITGSAGFSVNTWQLASSGNKAKQKGRLKRIVALLKSALTLPRPLAYHKGMPPLATAFSAAVRTVEPAG
ncbi:hypothetical protein [Pseudomonas anguilliseptica]|uniref:hypothetical protein n=1 Tax=Pseudomonas anguilliseptica TaxID=53406 RepID=UPI00325A84AA